MTLLLEEARSRVDTLLAQRRSLRTVGERTQHALDLVEMHFECENPERIDEAIRLYTDDAHWEAPTRRVVYQGPRKIKQMYLRLFAAFEECLVGAVGAVGHGRSACSTIPYSGVASSTMASRDAPCRSALWRTSGSCISSKSMTA